MVSDTSHEIEALFARIRSPETAKRFKLLRFATTQDLARTFRPERSAPPEQKELLCFQSGSKSQIPQLVQANISSTSVWRDLHDVN